MLIVFSGKSCSGKSSLVKYVCSLNSNSVYLPIDEIGHRVMDEDDVRVEVSQKFGIPLEKLDRKTLAGIVFNSTEKMGELTKITWPKMEEFIDKFIEKNKDKNILLDWALLPKTKYFELADLRILIESDFETRLKRAIERDGITQERFLEREKAAMDYSLYKFDYIIQNDDIEKVKKEIQSIITSNYVDKVDNM